MLDKITKQLQQNILLHTGYGYRMSNETTESYNATAMFKNLANSKNGGDVTFLVGNEKKIVYALKAVLSSVSPVFESMFFGDLKESSHVEVLDISFEGFSNMIK